MTTQAFVGSEGLRVLLLQLTYGVDRSWETSPEATELMTYSMQKYGALAHKHGFAPSDAAVAAFEVMQMRSTRLAVDPWAVITHAVELTLIYESRAEGLLCSTSQARKSAGTDFHDAERFSDRESDLADYHPAFQVYDDLTAIEGVDEVEADKAKNEKERGNAIVAMETATEFFIEVGWEPHSARLALEYICARMLRCGERPIAFASLRRDSTGPGLLDISHHAWVDVLRAVLGDPSPYFEGTARGNGMLWRLVSDEGLVDLFDDRALWTLVESTIPSRGQVEVYSGAGVSHV